MAKTSIDVDDEYLAAAREVLGTQTEEETVNAALRAVAAMADRRRDPAHLLAGDPPDLRDEEVRREPWR
ncbi:MAG TPA: type II toxin-antitoxin system VapB family antitoxin [Streptosporangiaceae bacterium]|nr:type II toxin-antitoxin system VapB family antitoxin [Streptosporangiaceae bacterium]